MSNGLKLVVLHDNVSLVRASNVEFDLEAMFEGEVYSDFFRSSRFATSRGSRFWPGNHMRNAGSRSGRSWQRSRERGPGRSCEAGVERAIQALGTGFRIARGNTGLRCNEALRAGDSRHAGVDRELLRMIYRVLLLLVAEDKRLGEDQNLLHPPTQRPRPAAAMASITHLDDSGSWRRSDVGRPTPTFTSRSRSSSRSCGLGMPRWPSPGSDRSCSRPRRPRISMPHLFPTSTCSKRPDTSATPRTSRDGAVR